MAITTVDGWLASAKQYYAVSKSSFTTVAALQYSLWQAAGVPAAGAAPGAAAIPTKATQGAVLFNNPTAPALSYLGRVDAMSSAAGLLILYDRVAHMGGLNGTLTTAQAVNTPTPDRGNVSGLGTEAFLEWYTTTGTTATTATVAWTDDTGTARSSAISIAASMAANRMVQIPMVATAAGVRSVQTVTLSASTLTAGNFGVTICNRLASVPILANTPISLDPFALGLSRVPDNACLFFAVIPNATASGALSTSIMIGQG